MMSTFLSNKMKTKKGQTIGALSAIVTALVAVAIVLAVGFLIMSETASQIQSSDGVNSTCQNTDGTYTSYACNGTQDTIAAIADIPGWLPIIVITMIGALLLGLVARFAVGRAQ